MTFAQGLVSKVAAAAAAAAAAAVAVVVAAAAAAIVVVIMMEKEYVCAFCYKNQGKINVILLLEYI
jgi:hypothetical protein